MELLIQEVNLVKSFNWSYTCNQYLHSLSVLWDEGHKHEAQGNLREAFICHQKCFVLIAEVIPLHPEFNYHHKNKTPEWLRFKEFKSKVNDRYDWLVKALHILRNDELKALESGTTDVDFPKYNNARPPLDILDDNTSIIEPKHLYEILNHHASSLSILFLDIRPREAYTKSRLTNRNVICIDPLILRSTATDTIIQDSLILSPAHEQKLFKSKALFDLIIYYDESSETTTYHMQILCNVLNSPTEVRTPLKRRPLFLKGGLKGWKKYLTGINAEADELQTKLISQSNEELENERSWLESLGKEKKYYESQIPLDSDNNAAKLRKRKVTLIDSSNQSSQMEKNFIDYLHMPATTVENELHGLNKASIDFLHASTPNYQYKIHRHFYLNRDTDFSLAQSYATAKRQIGLLNLGSTCYMNAVLQCLNAVDDLVGYFLTKKFFQSLNHSNPLGTKGILVEAFYYLIEGMWKIMNEYINPLPFIKVVSQIESRFKPNEQQDALDFLAFLLDGMHEDLNLAAKRHQLRELTASEERNREKMDPRLVAECEWTRYTHRSSSMIVDLFQGQYVSNLFCVRCGFRSRTFSPLGYLSVPIPQDIKHELGCDLLDCVKEFGKEEVLSGSNAWHCPKCQTFCTATKSMEISRAPKILIIHLKRFRSSGLRLTKLVTRVHFAFDSLLDLSPCIMKEYQNQSDFIPPLYQLFAVVHHFGTLESGHYTASIRDSDGSWFNADDTKINRSVSSIIDESSAYILFFKATN